MSVLAGGTTREIDLMYHVDADAVRSLVGAIELTTEDLMGAREAGSLLMGETPDGSEVYVQVGYTRPADAGHKSQFEQVGSVVAPTIIFIDVYLSDGETKRLFLYQEGRGNLPGEASPDCVTPPYWVGSAYLPGNYGGSQADKFDEVARAASGATDFKVVGSFGGEETDPADPNIQFHQVAY